MQSRRCSDYVDKWRVQKAKVVGVAELAEVVKSSYDPSKKTVVQTDAEVVVGRRVIGIDLFTLKHVAANLFNDNDHTTNSSSRYV